MTLALSIAVIFTICSPLCLSFPDVPADDSTAFAQMRTFLYGQKSHQNVAKPTINRYKPNPIERNRKTLERLLMVDCANGQHMVLTVDLVSPSLSDNDKIMLKSATISCGQTTCQSAEMLTYGDQLRFTLPYTEECGVDYLETNDTYTYSNAIVVAYNLTNETPVGARQLREYFKLKCIFPKSSTSPLITQSLNIYSDKGQLSPIKIPEKIQLGGLVYLQGNVGPNIYQLNEIHSFPVNCWTSPTAANLEKKFVLQAGCPKVDSRNRGLSQVYHVDQTPNRVGFHLGNYSLFPSHATVYITCQLLICVKSATTAVQGIPRCPDSRYCSYQNFNKHRLPDPLANAPLDTLTVGPISVYQTKEIDIAAQQRSNVLCSRSCPLTSVRSAEQIVVIGVGTPAVVTIAFSSFLLGLLIMGLLWLVHARTDPSKKLALAKAKGKHLSSNGDKVQYSETGHLSAKLSLLNCE